MLNVTTKEGRLTKEPNVKVYNNQSQNGQYQQIVAYFTIATDRNFKNRQGHYDADFFKCAVKGHSANYLANIVHVHRGDLILISGTEHANPKESFTSNTFFNQQGRPARIPQTYILVTSRVGYVHLESRARSNQGQPAPRNQGYQQYNNYPQNNMQQMNPMANPSVPPQQYQNQMRQNWPRTPFDNRQPQQQPRQPQPQPQQPQNRGRMPYPNQQPNGNNQMNQSPLHITNTNASGSRQPNPAGNPPMQQRNSAQPSSASHTPNQARVTANNAPAPSSASDQTSSASATSGSGKKIYKSDSDLPF